MPEIVSTKPTWKERRFEVIDEWKSRVEVKPRDYLYLAYGSNLNVQQMKRRCPNATPAGAIYLKDLRMVFRGVADIEENVGSTLCAGLWNITNHCEWELDVYEGYRKNGGGLYGKTFFTMENGQKAMVYYMNRRSHYSAPSNGYYDTIAQGYRDFDLPLHALEESLQTTKSLVPAVTAPVIEDEEDDICWYSDPYRIFAVGDDQWVVTLWKTKNVSYGKSFPTADAAKAFAEAHGGGKRRHWIAKPY